DRTILKGQNSFHRHTPSLAGFGFVEEHLRVPEGDRPAEFRAFYLPWRWRFKLPDGIVAPGVFRIRAQSVGRRPGVNPVDTPTARLLTLTPYFLDVCADPHPSGCPVSRRVAQGESATLTR